MLPFSIPFIPMLLAIVNSRLIALEGGLVNPLQALFLINGNACAGHQEPACGELCLSIAAIGSQLIPEDTLRQVFLHAVAIPKSSAYILLTQDMALEGCFTIPKVGFMVILFRSLGIGYVNSMMALTSLPIDRETMMPSAVL